MKSEVLEKDHYYHIYNRGINSCTIFINESNYNYFIRLFIKHLIPYVTVYAYCLLNNHFHFVIRVDTEPEIVSQKFSNFFNAYVKSFNNAHGRTGSLFERPFKRIKLDSEHYLINLIIYVNTNPAKHDILYNFEDYSFSSYHQTLVKNSQIIEYAEVLDLFDDLENFKYLHQVKRTILDNKFLFEYWRYLSGF